MQAAKEVRRSPGRRENPDGDPQVPCGRLMISRSFLKSKYCRKEVELALEAYENIKCLPIVVSIDMPEFWKQKGLPSWLLWLKKFRNVEIDSKRAGGQTLPPRKSHRRSRGT